MTKIVFLDFDGVLLPTGDEQAQIQTGLTRDNYLEQVVFNRQCVVNLNALLSQTGAEIVLSTSWAWGHTFSELSECLMRNKIDASSIFEWDEPDTKAYMTPRQYKSNRENEIGWWIDQHTHLDTWIAIDNIESIQALGERAIVVDPTVGFNAEALDKAIRVLMNDE